MKAAIKLTKLMALAVCTTALSTSIGFAQGMEPVRTGSYGVADRSPMSSSRTASGRA